MRFGGYWINFIKKHYILINYIYFNKIGQAKIKSDLD
jgi:hypothetical protein